VAREAIKLRWLPLGVVAAVCAVMQGTLGAWIEVQGARPSFLFMAVTFYGLHSPTVNAGIAGWVLGLAADLTSEAHFGVQSLTFALAGMAASRLRSLFVAENPIVQICITGLLCWASYTAIFLIDAWRSNWSAWGPGRLAVIAAWTALYTAVLTPYAHWLGGRISGWLGLEHKRKRLV